MSLKSLKNKIFKFGVGTFYYFSASSQSFSMKGFKKVVLSLCYYVESSSMQALKISRQ